ncbi:queuine tRNA-ribosyltransferase subunit QTRTD1 [Schistosoma bovis]|uniref:Queuine tRNA-ribosyltransferase accessory subunit 2 n=1 Tax=Schistosoma bovis TaxID=6184 RepID=A0A430QAU7_SCHBO|nr:queuine tRNA-ribosyltransferase subunit QTRTD1 [Schistosoma bovis]
MVKFDVLHTFGEWMRLGKLSESTNHLQIDLQTPGCLLYTRYGSVPFLPPDVYEKIELLPEFSFASMGYVAERRFSLTKFGGGIVKFAGLGKRGAFLFQSDPTHLAAVAAVSKSSVPVWTTGGRLQLSIAEYFTCSRIASPTAFQAPTDNETFLLDVNPTLKRITNSVVRTSGYLKKLASECTSHEEFAKRSVLVSIAGGYDLQLRLRSVAETDFSLCSGVVIDGVLRDLPVSSVEVKNYSDENKGLHEFLTTTLPKVFAHIPPHLPRFITQIWQPCDIALAASSGCDIFDGSLPYRLSRSGIGWIYKDWNENNLSSMVSDPKFLEFPFEESYNLDAEEWHLPIQPGCNCFTCLHHTRIYISHLHIAQEMLAPMLLMIHNSHQYYRFFSDLRRSISLNKIDSFITHAFNWRFPIHILTVDKTNEFKGAVNTDYDDV